MIASNKHIVAILFIIFFSFSAGLCVSGENSSVEYDFRETKHFILNFEKTEEKNQLPIDETEIVLESLWDTLEQSIGRHGLTDNDYLSQKNQVNNNRCIIYLLNNQSEYEKMVREKGRSHEVSTHGIFTAKTNSIFARRFPSSYTREILLHEATHYYCDTKLVGDIELYPRWFVEMIAIHFSQHSWDGKHLEAGKFPPQICFTGDSIHWKYLVNILESHAETEDDKHILNLASLDKIIASEELQTVFTGKEGRHRLYSLYRLIGNYLFLERFDIIQKIFRNLNNDQNLDAESDQLQINLSFKKACEQATNEKNIFFEDIIDWIKKSPTSWEVVYGPRWNIIPNGVTIMNRGILKTGVNKNFFHRIVCTSDFLNSSNVPVSQEFKYPGIIVNGVDNKNYDLLSVAPNGKIYHIPYRNNDWGNADELSVVLGRLVSNDSTYQFEIRIENNNDHIVVSISGLNIYESDISDSRFWGLYNYFDETKYEFMKK